jgi:hypothetical protein
MIGIIHSQFDQDATRFLNDAVITDPTQRLAINYLARELKLNSLWTKIIAAYPFIGGTLSTCSRNLKENANNLSFFNTVAGNFTSNGWTPNGTNSYANTNVNFPTETSLNSTALGFYSRTSNTTTGIDMGGSASSINSLIQLISGTTISTSINNSTNISSSITNTQGLFVVSRTSSVLTTAYRNGVSLNTSSAASISITGTDCFLGARSFAGIPLNFSNRQLAFAFISSGLTAGEVSTLYTIIQQYQTILVRQV